MKIKKVISKILVVLTLCSSFVFTKPTDIDAAQNTNTYTSLYNVNIRESPTIYSQKIGLLPVGSKITPIQSKNNWHKIYYSNKIGWVCNDYFTKNNYAANSYNSIVKRRLVIVNKTNLTTSYYSSGYLTNRFYCAIGKNSTPTPNGKFSIINKEKNRPYYKKGIKGGAANNPLGSRFIQLTYSGYAIHGTCYPNSIGTKASDGCVRLYNTNVNWLYDRVYVGDIVLIGTGTNRSIAQKYGYKIY